MNMKLRNDIILLLALLIAAAAVWGVISLTKKAGEYVVVEIKGFEVGRYRLDVDRVVTLDCPGGHVNELVIESGEAHIASADCPEQLCVKHRPIKMSGESIICLPHRVVVRIEGEGGVDTTV